MANYYYTADSLFVFALDLPVPAQHLFPGMQVTPSLVCALLQAPHGAGVPPSPFGVN